jgi:hypothetical protein
MRRVFAAGFSQRSLAHLPNGSLPAALGPPLPAARISRNRPPAKALTEFAEPPSEAGFAGSSGIVLTCAPFQQQSTCINLSFQSGSRCACLPESNRFIQEGSSVVSPFASLDERRANTGLFRFKPSSGARASFRPPPASSCICPPRTATQVQQSAQSRRVFFRDLSREARALCFSFAPHCVAFGDDAALALFAKSHFPATVTEPACASCVSSQSLEFYLERFQQRLLATP